MSAEVSPPTLAERIRGERDWLGLPRDLVAELVGVDLATVEAWEAGALVPSEDQVALLAGLFGLSVERLHGAPLVEDIGGVLMCGGDPTHDDQYEVVRFAEYLRHKKARR